MESVRKANKNAIEAEKGEETIHRDAGEGKQKPAIQEASTQTDSREENGQRETRDQQQAEEIRASFAKENMSKDVLHGLVGEAWPETAYLQTKIERKSFFQAPPEWNMVLVTDPRTAQTEGLVKTLSDRTPQIGDVAKKLEIGRVAYMVCTNQIVTDNDEEDCIEKRYLPFLVGVDKQQAIYDVRGELYEAFTNLRKLASKKGEDNWPSPHQSRDRRWSCAEYWNAPWPTASWRLQSFLRPGG